MNTFVFFYESSRALPRIATQCPFLIRMRVRPCVNYQSPHTGKTRALISNENHSTLSALISIEYSPKLLSATQNENTKTRERRFQLKTQMLCKTGNTLLAREEYELWPCQP